MVRTRITPKGRQIVDDLDKPVMAEHHRQLGHLSSDELETLIKILTKARNRK